MTTLTIADRTELAVRLGNARAAVRGVLELAGRDPGHARTLLLVAISEADKIETLLAARARAVPTTERPRVPLIEESDR